VGHPLVGLLLARLDHYSSKINNMATYGRGQMLGSGINPESFKQDFSGFARAAEIQAQGMANLGASIGGVIKDFGEQKKEQKKVDAYNKASSKAIEAAITLGKSYEVSGVEETLSPFLKAYNDPNLSPIEKAALLDEGKAMIPNVFGRFDASQADAIQRAQINARNAPPMPASLTYKRATNVPYGGGFLDDLLIGSDGEYYDEARNLVADMGAYARGESPEVYSGYSTFSDDLGGMDTPIPLLPGEIPAANIDYASGLRIPPQTGSFPTDINIASSAPSLDAGEINASRIEAALDGGVLVPRQEIAQLEKELGIDENQRREIKSRLRFDTDKEELQEPVTITIERLNELSASGVRAEGSLNPDGTFSVTGFKTGSLPQGMTIESDGQGGIKVVQGSGVGGKLEKAQQAKESLVDQNMQDLYFLEDRTMDMAPGVTGAVGRLISEKVFATKQAENKAIIDRISSRLTLGTLQSMRENSPTGGSLGNVSDKDIEVLRNSATSLSNAQSPEEFHRELIRLQNLQYELIHGSEDLLKKKLKSGEITQDQFDSVQANRPVRFLGGRGEVMSRDTQPSQKPSIGLTPDEMQFLESRPY
jgi:hypothetical protein